MVIIPFVSPAGKILSTYEHRVPLTGTGPFSVGEYFLPDGWVAHIVGTTLVFTGMATEVSTGFDASFEIFSCCDCDPVTLTTSIVINSGCTYSWSMNPTIAVVGTPIKTTFTPPRSCPLDAVLRLDVFRADGVTPYIELAISTEPLVITIPSGSSVYVVQASDAGADILFKPSTQQSACLTTCTPSNTSQRRIVPPRSDCNIIWTFTTYQFAAGAPTKQTFSVTGLPKGGIAVLDLYVGNVLQDYGDVVLSYENPSVTVGPLTFPAFSLGSDFNYRPRSPLLGSAVGCRILPARKDFDVVASVVCAINWRLDINSFLAGVPTPQTYSATGIPVGGGVAFDLYIGNVLQTYGDFTLTEAVPSITPGNLTFPAAVIGSDFNYRPRTPSLNTATACTVTPSKIPFSVTGLVCSINWKLETDLFAANVPKHQTYSATGIPLGGAVAFDLYLGAVVQNYGDFTLTGEAPSVTPGSLTFPEAVIGLDFNYKPRTPSLGQAVTCAVNPAKVPFRVVAGVVAPVNPVCAVNWHMQTTLFVAGTPTPQIFTATGLVPGASLVLKLYDGATIQTYGDVTLTYDTPSVNVGNLTFPLYAVGASYSYRPVTPLLGTGAGCSVTPSTQPFTVASTAAPAPPASGTCTPAALCVTAETEFAVAPGNASSVGAPVPIVFDTVPVLYQYKTTSFTNTTPTKKRFVLPITITSGATTVGDAFSGVIQLVPGFSASAGNVRFSVSRSSCSFVTDACGFMAAPRGNNCSDQPSIYFSVNDAGRFGGSADVNLTTGTWYINIEICDYAALQGLPYGYNINKLIRVQYK